MIKNQDIERQKHMDAAISYMQGVIDDAELRGLSGYDVAISLAAIVAGRDPKLAGECLVALLGAIQSNPVTKIVSPPAEHIQ